MLKTNLIFAKVKRFEDTYYCCTTSEAQRIIQRDSIIVQQKEEIQELKKLAIPYNYLLEKETVDTVWFRHPQNSHVVACMSIQDFISWNLNEIKYLFGSSLQETYVMGEGI